MRNNNNTDRVFHVTKMPLIRTPHPVTSFLFQFAPLSSCLSLSLSSSFYILTPFGFLNTDDCLIPQLFSFFLLSLIYQYPLIGALNRATAATGMNEGSSRSHSVFTVTGEQYEELEMERQ